MTNQRKFDIGSVRRAIEAVGASPSAIAEYLGCSRSTVYGYLRRHPELKTAFEETRGSEVDERVQYTREAFERAIAQSYGVKASVAAAVGCSRQTVDNAFQRWPDLLEMFDAQRSLLVSKSVSSLVHDIDNRESDGHVRAYMFVLKTLGKEEGFVERSEVTGADGEALISPDIARLIAQMGLDSSEVVRQFETMVRAAAVRKGITE